MERDDLRQVMERLEAVAALSTLFKNLWYEKIKDEVESEKVRAYLIVYEDAVPLLNHILQYAHYSASLLAEGRLDQDKYERLQMAFGQLGAALLGRDVDAGMEMPGLDDLESAVEISPEQEAEMEGDLFEAEDLRTIPQGREDAPENTRLEGVSQDEVEALLTDSSNGTPAGIDSLFESSDSQIAPASSQEEIDALLDEPADEGDADGLDDLLTDEAEDQPAEEELELGEQEETQAEEEKAGDEDLSDLLDSIAEEGEEQEGALDLGDLELDEDKAGEEEGSEPEAEMDLGDLELEEEKAGDDAEQELEAASGGEEGDLDLSDLDLGEETTEEGELDLSDLIEEEDQAGKDVSDDDLTALLNGEVEEEEPPKPAPKAAAPAPKAPPKPAPKAAAPAPKVPAKPAPKAAAPAPKAPAKPAPKAAPAKNDKQDEDSISQDEIDALFG